jgi:alkylation response protein AidB-like acyl-CoA dehydrogenase
MNADLLYSDTEEALRDSVRHLLADRCPLEAVAALYDPAPPDFSGVWKELAADLGLAGLLVPEQLGGAGAGAREASYVVSSTMRCRTGPSPETPRQVSAYLRSKGMSPSRSRTLNSGSSQNNSIPRGTES